MCARERERVLVESTSFFPSRSRSSPGLAATNSLYHARFFFRARDVVGLRKSASRFGVLLLVWRKDRPEWTVNREREPIAP